MDDAKAQLAQMAENYIDRTRQLNNELRDARSKPNLGLATTDQLLHELEVRFEVSGRLAAHDAVAWVHKTALDSEALAYRTVDHA